MTLVWNGGTGGAGDWVDIPPTIEIFEPPDDRYFPGYKITDNVDGDIKIYGPRLKDLNVPFSLYGLSIPITFGVRRLYGNIIWARPLRESLKKTTNTAGKGGGPTTVSKEYQYFGTFAVALGIPGNTDSTTRDILRIWAQGSMIFDRRSFGSTAYPGVRFTFYKGEATQEPDPIIAAAEGIENTPAYRDVMYLVFNDLPLEKVGNIIPSISAEIGDATAVEYLIRNIETPDVNGEKTVNIGFPDWDNNFFYTVKAGGELGLIRTYNLTTGEYIGHVVPNTTGVGYDRNFPLQHNPPPAYVNKTGLSANFDSIGYIPWENLIIAKPVGLNTAEPVMLIDPSSGTVKYWIGCHILSGGAFNPVFPGIIETGPVILNGFIPQWYYAHPFKALNGFAIVTFLMVQTIYNDLVVLKIDNLGNRLDMMTFFTNWGFATCMTQGAVGLTSSDLYIAKSGGSGGEVHKMTAQGGATRAGGTPSAGVGKLELWHDFGRNIHTMWYLSVDDSMIIIFTDGYMRKVKMTNISTLWEIAIPGHNEIPELNNHLHNFEGGTFAWTADGDVNVVDLTFGTLVSWPEADNKYFAFTKYSDSRNNTIVGSATASSSGLSGSTTHSIDYAASTLYFNRLSDARMTLAAFILGMCLYAGFTEEQIYIDPSIDDTIDGAIISKLTSFKAVMQSICTAYRIEMFESAGQIKFTRRAIGSGAVSFEITDTHLLMQSGDSLNQEEPTLQIRREEELSVPQKVTLRYIEKALGYQWNMQFAQRSQFILTNGSDEQLNLELPIIMTATEAKTMVTRILWQAWNSRVAYSFRVAQRFAKIEPGDFGTLTSDGRLFNVRVAQVSYNTDFSISIQAVNAISDEAITIVGDSGGTDLPPIPSKTLSEIYVLDIPLLAPGDDLSYLGISTPIYYYLGPVALEQTWAGGTGYVSLDGMNFAEMAMNIDTGLVCTVINVPAFDEGTFMTWDETNVMIVAPKQGDMDLLASATALEVLSGANLCAYGSNGNWEVVAFREVTDNGDGTFTLSGLLRGLKSTDFQLESHQAGDALILLDRTRFADSFTIPFTSLGKVLSFKGVGFNENITNTPSKTLTFAGYSALPPPPWGLTGDRVIADGTGDIEFNWIRRSRVNGPLVDFVENEALTPYETDDYKLTFYRHPHYDTWEYDGGSWRGLDLGTAADSFSVEVTGATTYTLTAATIRANELYEFEAPDDVLDFGSAFTQHGGSYIIPENAVANIQMPDLGYNEFVAFRTIDVMIQQKTTIGNASGYGPGRRVTIVIRDT